MFKFLKEKIRNAISKISKKTEEEVKEEIKETVKQKSIKEKIKEKFKKKVKEEKVKVEETEEPKKKFFEKFKISRKISEEKFEELFYDLEIALMENNVAVEVVDKIKEEMKVDLVDEGINGRVEDAIKNSLKESLESVLNVKKIDLIEEVKKKKPYVILFLGVNGNGKTTSIAKFAHLLLKNNLKCVLVAGDTWRKAAIEQLEEWGKKLGVKVIKQQYGADPAAVGFDGRKYAEANNVDVVLMDTAGRQHSNVNLMNEMEKIVRVIKPEFKMFIAEALVGNDAVEQAKRFNEKVGIDGITLTKVDVDEKGGAAISIGYMTGKPILYVGNGQKVDDVEEFDSKKIIGSLGI